MDAERPALSVVIPVYNEEALLVTTVEQLLDALPAFASSFEVVLAQNGSTDRTVELAEGLARRHAAVRVVHHPRPDYGRALQLGCLAARGAAFVNFAIDFVDLEFLRVALPMLAEYDLVLGSKHLEPENDRRPALRRYGGRVFHGMVRVLFGLPVHDTHGIKAHRAATVQRLVTACRQGGGLFDTELVLRAHRAGLRLCEIPVHVAESRPSRTGVAGRALEALVDLARLRVMLWTEASSGDRTQHGL